MHLIQWHTHTLGRTSLQEGSARRRDLHLITHNVKVHSSTPPAGFETAIPVSERPQALWRRGHRHRQRFLCGDWLGIRTTKPYIYVHLDKFVVFSQGYLLVVIWLRYTDFGNVGDYQCRRVCKTYAHSYTSRSYSLRDRQALHVSACIQCNCRHSCVNCTFRILLPKVIYCLPILSFYKKLCKNKYTVLNKKHFKVLS